MGLDPLAVFDIGQLRSWLKISDSTQDEILEILGAGVSSYVEARTATKWKKRTYTITRDGDGRAVWLRLPRPIVSVASLTVDGSAVAAADFAMYADAGKIALRSRVFNVGIQNVSVVLDAGYDQVPWDVLSAALDLAKAHYEEWTNGAISLSSISIGSASAIIKPGLNPRIERFLDAKKDVRG